MSKPFKFRDCLVGSGELYTLLLNVEEEKAKPKPNQERIKGWIGRAHILYDGLLVDFHKHVPADFPARMSSFN